MSWHPEPPLPDFATYRSGELHIDQVPIRELILSYGTPLVAYSASRVKSTTQHLANALVSGGGMLAYALKACYFPTVTRYIAGAGLRAEVMSSMEWLLACKAGFDPTEMIVNGPGKSAAALRLMLEGGSKQFNIDSEDDLLRLADTATLTHTEPAVLIRVHTDLGDALFARRAAKLGFDIKSGEALAVCKRAAGLPGIRFVGLSAHVLSRQTTGRRHSLLVDELLGFAEQVEQQTGQLAMLNLGGGFDSRYLTDVSEDVPSILRHLVDQVHQWRANLLVQFELGRYCVGDAAVAVGQVLSVKQTAGFQWVIVDTGTNVLIPTPSAWFQAVPVSPGEGEVCTLGVADGICSPANVIQAHASMPVPKPGDYLAVFNAGAYTTAMAESWTFPLPPAVMVEGDQVSPMFTRAQACAVTEALYGLSDVRIFS